MLATIATILADKEEEFQKRGVPPEHLKQSTGRSINFLTERMAALMQLIVRMAALVQLHQVRQPACQHLFSVP